MLFKYLYRRTLWIKKVIFNFFSGCFLFLRLLCCAEKKSLKLLTFSLNTWKLIMHFKRSFSFYRLTFIFMTSENKTIYYFGFQLKAKKHSTLFKKKSILLNQLYLSYSCLPWKFYWKHRLSLWTNWNRSAK